MLQVEIAVRSPKGRAAARREFPGAFILGLKVRGSGYGGLGLGV